MPIRIRLRTKNGQHTLSLPDDAAVSDLLSSISTATDLPLFTLKWGYPPQLLDPSLYGLSTPISSTDLKLNGAQIIVDAEATGDPSEAAARAQETSEAATKASPAAPLSLKSKQSSALDEPPEVPLPSQNGTLVLRIMPDDNSCLFRAFGTALLTASLDSMDELRSFVAQRIQADPETYNAAVLDRPPDEYCAWITHTDSWGGGIELSILSKEFDVEICSVNVQDLRIDRFNEGARRRCILVYSGIHYDTIAFVPGGGAGVDADHDVKLFDAADDEVLEAAKLLCAELRKKHYYTDTKKFNIKCNTCGWKGAGEVGATQHFQESGHTDFGEGE